MTSSNANFLNIFITICCNFLQAGGQASVRAGVLACGLAGGRVLIVVRLTADGRRRRKASATNSSQPLANLGGHGLVSAGQGQQWANNPIARLLYSNRTPQQPVRNSRCVWHPTNWALQIIFFKRNWQNSEFSEFNTCTCALSVKRASDDESLNFPKLSH